MGDLDGDGEYEIVLKQEQRPRDNSQKGATGETKLEAYKLDGRFLWRINLGKNVREGAHYTQLLVYDLDGDGRAEVVCKTADGIVGGTGAVPGDPKADYRNADGYVLDGPEFPTVFDGRTGRPNTARTTTGGRYVQEWGWLGRSVKRPGLYARRIRVVRGNNDPVVVLTSLRDPARYPAVAVLEGHKNRIDIEYVFQRITGVFQLRQLIGTSPRATLFQLSLCLLLYNVLQLVRVAGPMPSRWTRFPPRSCWPTSGRMLVAVHKVPRKPAIIRAVGDPLTADELGRLLGQRLARWTKAKRRRNRPPKSIRKSGHACGH